MKEESIENLKDMPQQMKKEVIEKYVNYLLEKTMFFCVKIAITFLLCLMTYILGFTNGIQTGANTYEAFQILKGN